MYKLKASRFFRSLCRLKIIGGGSRKLNLNQKESVKTKPKLRSRLSFFNKIIKRHEKLKCRLEAKRKALKNGKFEARLCLGSQYIPVYELVQTKSLLNPAAIHYAKQLVFIRMDSHGLLFSNRPSIVMESPLMIDNKESSQMFRFLSVPTRVIQWQQIHALKCSKKTLTIKLAKVQNQFQDPETIRLKFLNTRDLKSFSVSGVYHGYFHNGTNITSDTRVTQENNPTPIQKPISSTSHSSSNIFLEKPCSKLPNLTLPKLLKSSKWINNNFQSEIILRSSSSGSRFYNILQSFTHHNTFNLTI